MLSTHPLACWAVLSCSFVLGQLAFAEPRVQAAPWERHLAPTPIHVKVLESSQGAHTHWSGPGCQGEPPQHLWAAPVAAAWLSRLFEKSQETKQNRGNWKRKKLFFFLLWKPEPQIHWLLEMGNKDFGREGLAGP